MSKTIATVTEAALTPTAARSLTDEVKADAQALWDKCLRLYEGGAHLALGHTSWAAYWEAEFGRGKSDAYRVLDAARVVRMLPESPNGERLNEAQARELAPLKKEQKTILKAFQSAKDIAASQGAKLTSEHVRYAVVEIGRKKAGKAALENGNTAKAAELLGFRMRHAPRCASFVKQAAPAKLPVQRIPAALAASELIRAESDAIRAKKGLPPVPESVTVRSWRRRLDEQNGTSPAAAAVAAVKKVRGDYSGEDRAKLDAAIVVLKRDAP